MCATFAMYIAVFVVEIVDIHSEQCGYMPTLSIMNNRHVYFRAISVMFNIAIHAIHVAIASFFVSICNASSHIDKGNICCRCPRRYEDN